MSTLAQRVDVIRRRLRRQAAAEGFEVKTKATSASRALKRFQRKFNMTLPFTQRTLDRWLFALRSGEYKQGKETLAQLDKKHEKRLTYCCQGVLCDVIDPQGWKEGYRDIWVSEVIFGNLAKSAYGWADSIVLHDMNVSVSNETNAAFDMLTTLNDILDFTFLEIADFVQYYFKGQDMAA